MQSMSSLANFIQWCNENVGFATIMLSVLTLLVSIFAVIVSIRTARLPYKKSIKIEAGSYKRIKGESGLHVTAISCGNMDFTVSSMGFITKDSILIANLFSNIKYPVTLKNGERITECFSDETDAIHDLKSSRKIIAYVQDSENKIYRKRVRIK